MHLYKCSTVCIIYCATLQAFSIHMHTIKHEKIVWVSSVIAVPLSQNGNTTVVMFDEHCVMSVVWSCGVLCDECCVVLWCAV